MASGLDDSWQDFARFLLQDAIAQRVLTYRQLSNLLSEKGLVVAPKSLARRINRGSFDAGFFLLCLTVLGAVRIDFEAEGVGDVVLQPERTWARGRTAVPKATIGISARPNLREPR